MTITIRLKTGNAAFHDDDADEHDKDAHEDARDAEIARILRIWVDRGCGDGPLPYDYNGNTVGSVTITGK